MMSKWDTCCMSSSSGSTASSLGNITAHRDASRFGNSSMLQMPSSGVTSEGVVVAHQQCYISSPPRDLPRAYWLH